MPTLTSPPIDYEHSTQAITSFIESVDGKVLSFEGHERRTHARYVVAIPSVVWPLDKEHRPQGKSLFAVTRDISVGGISLIHSQPATTKFLGVKLTLANEKEIHLLIKVLRCRPLGTYYDIAGEFVTVPE